MIHCKKSHNYSFHICLVLRCLLGVGLEVDFDKCKFYMQAIKFVSFIVFIEDI